MIRMILCRTTLALALLWTVTATAAERWETLPPMPTLPRPAAVRYVAVNGARIWCGQWNPASHETPVLLLHGGYANSSYYGHLIRDLVKQHYRVIAIDSRGHGRSTRSDAPYSYHLMAEDVVGVLKALAIARVSLVGWSDGGTIGYDLAIHHPDVLARMFVFGANADVTGLKEGFDQTPTFAAYLKRVRGEYGQLSSTPNDWDAFDAAIGKMWSSEPAFTAAELASIRTPTTIADGEHDEGIRPEHLRYLSSTIPGARLVILTGVSHFAMLQDPAKFDEAVLTFLRGP